MMAHEASEHPSYRLSTQPPPLDPDLPDPWGYHPSEPPQKGAEQ